MAGTHFKGPVDSILGFTVNGVAIAGSGGAQALADNTSGTPGVSVEQAAVTSPTLDVDVTGSDTVDKTALNADLVLLKTLGDDTSTAIATLNDNIASIVAALAAAGIVT